MSPSKRRVSLLLMLMLPAVARAQTQPASRITSPDGKVAVEFHLAGDAPAYSIQFHGQPVVLESKLGFEPDFTSGFTLVGSATSEHASSWINPLGERRNVPDNYHQLDVDLQHVSGKRIRVTLRAYDEGAALRYTFPAQETKSFAFAGEHTEFRFPAEMRGYQEHGTEGDYLLSKIVDFKPWCERPLTLEFSAGIYASLNEAGNLAYPRMLLSPLPNSTDTLVSALGGSTSNTERGGTNDGHITIAAGDSTPWRLFVLGDSPGDLLERNYLLLNLNAPSVIKDTSWIKPFKAMRDGSLTTASAKAIIDLAPKLGIDHVGFDDHWFGPDDTSDATQVRAPNLNLPEVIAYGKEHHVGVLLYVDARQMKKQADELLPLYKSWGVDAMKIGFVPVGSQADTTWLTDVVAKAAANNMVLDIHDGYRSTGINRTYPNLLTVEGIQGNEHQPTPEHNCTLPFTRYVGGVGDYTLCYLDRRIKTTHAHQLAMGVVSFSPMQWLYWYDKPEQLKNVPAEAEFWVRMPTVWDLTKVIDGKIGQYASIARQSGKDWFIGTINNSQPRTLKLPLSFLEPGKAYTAHMYEDDDGSATPTKVAIRTALVNNGTTLDATLKAGGGQAIWIEAGK